MDSWRSFKSCAREFGDIFPGAADIFVKNHHICDYAVLEHPFVLWLGAN